MYKSLERGPVELLPFFEECSNLVSIESTNKIRAMQYGRRPNINMPRYLDFLQWVHISTLEAFWAPAQTWSGRVFRKLSLESGHPIARFIPGRCFLRGKLFRLNGYCFDRASVVNQRRKERLHIYRASLGLPNFFTQSGEQVHKLLRSGRDPEGTVLADDVELAAQLADYRVNTTSEIAAHVDAVLHYLLMEKGYAGAARLSTLLRNSQCRTRPSRVSTDGSGTSA